ncbi:MAG: hypothetical protein P1U56_00690 [Saprospiraceae bacterium]|nr:hypothetical protein [Saprospiraceae bacterium]
MNQIPYYFVITFILSIGVQDTQAQSIDGYIGLNLNRFFDTSKDDRPYNRSVYNSNPNLTFGISFNDIYIFRDPIDFSINFERYGGEVSGRTGGLGGGTSIKATTYKNVVSLIILPLKFRLGSFFEFKYGLNLGMLLSESVEGTRTTSAGNSPTSQSLQKDQVPFNSKLNFGLIGQVKYLIPISEKITILPFYQYYFGLSKEFRNFPKNTKSMRHCLGFMVRNNL